MHRHKLILFLTVVLALAFSATSFFSYKVSQLTIHNAIVDSELPLTADNVYSEIQKDLVRTVFISSMMASDTFLRDWIVDGEKGTARISKYLQQVQDKYGAFISFFVSEKTKNYYYGQGILKKVQADEPRDAWYFRVQQMQAPYELNVDKDLAHHDALTIFVNYRVLDYNNHYLGTTGVGLAVDSVQKLIDSYQQKFKRTVYFVSPEGKIMLSSNQKHLSGTQIQQIAGLGDIFKTIASQQSGSFEYKNEQEVHLVNVRYIPELKWYLFVEKSESDATYTIRKTLYLNLLLCLIVTSLVILMTHIALKRYQSKVDTLATTDSLTGLANRRAFDIVFQQMYLESQRDHYSLGVVLFDLDHFKDINDRYGHLSGDFVLTEVAKLIKQKLRAVDFICRWGGEEFLILLKESDINKAQLLAEKVRQVIESHLINYQAQSLEITASFGVTTVKTKDTLQQALERVDRAMYQAKAQGRNCVVTIE